MADVVFCVKKGLFQLIFCSFKKKIEKQKLHICKLLSRPIM